VFAVAAPGSLGTQPPFATWALLKIKKAVNKISIIN